MHHEVAPALHFLIRVKISPVIEYMRDEIIYERGMNTMSLTIGSGEIIAEVFKCDLKPGMH
jgi:hypothetical protein